MSYKRSEFFENVCLQNVYTDVDFAYIETEKISIFNYRMPF